MAEICKLCCFKLCARNAALICILIEPWGGTAKKKTAQAPLLHLGLSAIKDAAKVELSYDQHDPS
jgi:hypothetical protein